MKFVGFRILAKCHHCGSRRTYEHPLTSVTTCKACGQLGKLPTVGGTIVMLLAGLLFPIFGFYLSSYLNLGFAIPLAFALSCVVFSIITFTISTESR